MFFYRRTVPGLAIHSYIVGDDQTKTCAVIDPVRDIDEYISVAEEEGLCITDILETHVHADFVSGSRELKHRLGNKPKIHCSGMGGKEWIPTYADHVVKEGDQVKLGNISLKAIHTPGHTPEHLMWALYEEMEPDDVPDWLFTGDFLFVGDVGRPDLLGEEVQEKLAQQLYQSVFTLLNKYSDSVEIFPAHGAGSLCGKSLGTRPSSTLGIERHQNPAMVRKADSEWISGLMQDMPKAPPYFSRMKKINVEGPQIIGCERPEQKSIGPKEVQEMIQKDCLLVDVRSKEAFSAAHIPGAINLPLGPAFASWAGWILPYDQPIVIVCNNPAHIPGVVDNLLRVGIDQVAGYLKGGMTAWENQGLEISHVETITVQELVDRIENKPPFILDVRTDQEWQADHIEKAHHIPVGPLKVRIHEVPRGCEVAVVCGSGYRSSIAASILKREGYRDVANVFGGMTAWKQQGLPITIN